MRILIAGGIVLVIALLIVALAYFGNYPGG